MPKQNNGNLAGYRNHVQINIRKKKTRKHIDWADNRMRSFWQICEGFTHVSEADMDTFETDQTKESNR